MTKLIHFKMGEKADICVCVRLMFVVQYVMTCSGRYKSPLTKLLSSVSLDPAH